MKKRSMKQLERMAGYDPALPVWKTGVLPVTPHPRVNGYKIVTKVF